MKILVHQLYYFNKSSKNNIKLFSPFLKLSKTSYWALVFSKLKKKSNYICEHNKFFKPHKTNLTSSKVEVQKEGNAQNAKKTHDTIIFFKKKLC